MSVKDIGFHYQILKAKVLGEAIEAAIVKHDITPNTEQQITKKMTKRARGGPKTTQDLAAIAKAKPPIPSPARTAPTSKPILLSAMIVPTVHIKAFNVWGHT